MKVTVQIKGSREVLKRLEEMTRRYRAATAAALYQEGLALDARANANDMIPVDTGRMRATHYVAPPTIRGGRLFVEIGYGTSYAIYVHERTDLAHRVGRAGWLRAALNERAAGFPERLAARIKRNVATGVGSDALSGGAPSAPQDPGAGSTRKALRISWRAERKASKMRAARQRNARRQKGRK